MKLVFHIHGAIRVEYRVRTRALEPNLGAIASEKQTAGGSGALCALALARLGARVRLSGNSLGDDSHGRFLRAQVEAAGIETDSMPNAQAVTPYAILLRGDDCRTQTLLSPEALAVSLPPLGQIEEGARVLDFSVLQPPGSSASNHAYAASLSSLEMALRMWLEAARPAEPSAERQAQLGRWMEELDQGFGAWPF